MGASNGDFNRFSEGTEKRKGAGNVANSDLSARLQSTTLRVMYTRVGCLEVQCERSAPVITDATWRGQRKTAAIGVAHGSAQTSTVHLCVVVDILQK